MEYSFTSFRFRTIFVGILVSACLQNLIFFLLRLISSFHANRDVSIVWTNVPTSYAKLVLIYNTEFLQISFCLFNHVFIELYLYRKFASKCRPYNKVEFKRAIQRSFYGSKIKTVLFSIRNLINCCRKETTLRMYSDPVHQYLVFEYENSFQRRLEI